MKKITEEQAKYLDRCIYNASVRPEEVIKANKRLQSLSEKARKEVG